MLVYWKGNGTRTSKRMFCNSKFSTDLSTNFSTNFSTDFSTNIHTNFSTNVYTDFSIDISTNLPTDFPTNFSTDLVVFSYCHLVILTSCQFDSMWALSFSACASWSLQACFKPYTFKSEFRTVLCSLVCNIQLSWTAPSEILVSREFSRFFFYKFHFSISLHFIFTSQ